METDRDRILTTHVGSLPRRESLADLLVAKAHGETVDADALDDAVAGRSKPASISATTAKSRAPTSSPM